MKIEIDIPDDKLQNLSATAKDEVGKVSKAYIEEVLDEASRIEESRRTTNSNPEVTAAIISDAVYFAKNFGIRKKKPKKQILLQIISFVSSTVTGGLFDVDEFNDKAYVGLFLFVFLVAIVSTVYLIFNDNSND
ncbi:MAG: hypothetical protein ACOYXT_13670 [Bacteroidota bacterium]